MIGLLFTFKYKYLLLSLFDHFYPVMSYHTDEREKESDELLVARYGPRTSCQRKGVEARGI